MKSFFSPKLVSLFLGDFQDIQTKGGLRGTHLGEEAKMQLHVL